jgi:hypothetical protein
MRRVRRRARSSSRPLLAAVVRAPDGRHAPATEHVLEAVRRTQSRVQLAGQVHGSSLRPEEIVRGYGWKANRGAGDRYWRARTPGLFCSAAAILRCQAPHEDDEGSEEWVRGERGRHCTLAE